MESSTAWSVFSSLRELPAATILLAIAAAALLVPGSAKANTVYSYTGNTFTQIVDSTTVPGTYTTSMKVTGSIEVASPLGPNFDNLSAFTIPAFVVGFSFNDGRQTIDQSFFDAEYSFIGLKTDTNGTITGWDIHLVAPSLFPFVAFIKSSTVLGSDFGTMYVVPATGNEDFGEVDFNFGLWTVVPEPKSVSLFALGLLGLAWPRRRR
jgi:hypothetical protein